MGHKRGKYLAIDTTNELLYLATFAKEILKLDVTGSVILKATPYSTMYIFSIDLSADLTKLLVVGSDDTTKCLMIVLSTSDLSILNYSRFTTTSSCFRSVNAGGKWFMAGYEVDVPGVFLEMQQGSYALQKKLIYKPGINGNTHCMIVEASTANVYLGC